MLRGGLAGLGARGGLGAKDGDEPAGSVSLRGFRSKDQGGAFSNGATRVHIAGLHVVGEADLAALSPLPCQNIQGGGSGEMLILIPEYFERGGWIRRLVTRTNGGTGSDGTPLLKMGVWTSGTLGSGTLSGTPYPDERMAQSSDLALLPGGNRLLETVVAAPVDPGTYVWFGLVVNADAAANAHVIWGLRRNALYPIHGFTCNVGGPTTIAQDSLSFSVGFRHAITYETSEDLPNPCPSSAPALLNAGGAVDTINLPAIGYGFEEA